MADLDPSEFDYGDEHTPRPAHALIAELQEMIDEAGQLSDEVRELTSQLAEKSAFLADLTDKQIPNKMKLCGLKSLETEQGYHVEIETDLFAGIPSITSINKERDPVKREYMINRRFDAFEWLEKNGHDKIITREVVVQFDKGQKEVADALVEELKNSDRPMHVTEGIDVHHSTLRALLKRLRKESADFPAETFGVFDKAVAKVSKS